MTFFCLAIFIFYKLEHFEMNIAFLIKISMICVHLHLHKNIDTLHWEWHPSIAPICFYIFATTIHGITLNIICIFVSFSIARLSTSFPIVATMWKYRGLWCEFDDMNSSWMHHSLSSIRNQRHFVLSGQGYMSKHFS